MEVALRILSPQITLLFKLELFLTMTFNQTHYNKSSTSDKTVTQRCQ